MTALLNRPGLAHAPTSMFHQEEKEAFCFPEHRSGPEVAESGQWESLREALRKWAAFVGNIAELTARIDNLERKLSDNRSSIVIPIQTLDPEPFDLLKEIKVVVRPADDEFVASFFDANVNASGCTVADAVNNLKEIVVKRFDRLDKTAIDKLGPAMVRQIAVLRVFIRKRA